MLRSIVILISCSAGYFVDAHPHCYYDLREVDLDRELAFCSMDYATEGVCCTEAEEASLADTYYRVDLYLSTECADYLKQVCPRQPQIGKLLCTVLVTPVVRFLR